MEFVDQYEYLGYLRKYLNGFDLSTRLKGERLYNDGCVFTLESAASGQAVHSVVDCPEGARSVSFSVREDEDQIAWDSNCDCELGGRCEHSFAVAIAALRGMERARKAAKSRKNGTRKLENAAPMSRSSRKRDEKFVDMMRRELGRALTRDEREYCVSVDILYGIAKQQGSLSVWDLRQARLFVKLRSWERIAFWAEFPKTARSFWLHLAHFAKTREVALPEFVRPFTDTSEIADELAAYEAKRSLEDWEHALNLLGESGRPWTGQGRPVELRLCLGLDGATLNYRIGEGSRFRRLNASADKELWSGLISGKYQFAEDSASEMMWHALVGVSHNRDHRYEYQDLGFAQRLSLFAENEHARDLLINEATQTLKVSERVSLRWELEGPDEESGNYFLTLLDGAGAPVEKPVRVIPTPSDHFWYLTIHELSKGPLCVPPLIAGDRNRLPEALLRSEKGHQMLYRLGVELPESLSAKRRLDVVQPVLRCEMTRPFKDEPTEEVHIRALGVSSLSGYPLAVYDGSGWRHVNGESRAGEAVPESEIRVRDFSKLALIPDAIENFGGKYAERWEAWIFRVTKRFPTQFSEWLNRVPDEVRVELSSELESLKDATIQGTLRIEVEESEIDWFDLKIVVDVGETQLSPEELKLLMDAKGDWVNLPDKGWKRLQYELSEEDNEELASLGLNPKQLTSEPQRVHALQLAQPASRKFLDEGRMAALSRRASEIQARVNPAVPEEARCDLRDYQVEGFHFLAYLTANRFGGVLADDMGLGKTLQTLTWLTWLRTTEQWTSGCALVICPKSVVNNWVSEIDRFTPMLRVKAAGSAGLKDLSKALKKIDVLVINYSVARLRAEALKGVEWAAIVLDEAQAIKNPTSQAAELARDLRSPRRLALTGTPIENRLMDLWSIMAFAMPGLLGNRSAFNRTYDGRGDPLARRRLAARVRPFLLRRTKSQVARDLPDRIEEDVLCELEGQQKTMYRAELKAAQQILLKIQTQKELDKSRFNILTSLLRLRQVCCHPKLVNEDSKGKSAKLEALIDQLETVFEEGEKALVFSQFVTMLDLIHDEAREREWTVFKLTGSTENRGELVDSFQRRKGPAVFLISLKAGGSGLNLTAANYVFLFDPWWNPAVENQAIDRTHRIGQESKVIAYRMLMKGTIEEKVRALQRQKSELVAEALGDESFSSALSLEDFRFLLSE